MQITLDLTAEELIEIIRALQKKKAIKVNVDGVTIGRSVYEAIHDKPQED